MAVGTGSAIPIQMGRRLKMAGRTFAGRLLKLGGKMALLTGYGSMAAR